MGVRILKYGKHSSEIWNVIPDVIAEDDEIEAEKREMETPADITVGAFIKNAKELIAYDDDELRGFRPVDIDIRSDFFIAVGVVCEVSEDTNGNPVIRLVNDTKEGSFVVEKYATENKRLSRIQERAEALKPGMHVCILGFGNDKCADFKIGPYFGRVTWKFCQCGKKHVLKKYHVG